MPMMACVSLLDGGLRSRLIGYHLMGVEMRPERLTVV